METFLRALLGFIVPFFAIVSMAGAGLGETVRDISDTLRRPVPVLAALLGNFVLVPLLGFGIVRWLRLEPAHAIGLFLMSAGAGAAFLVALARSAKADLTLATGLLVLLLITSIIYMPIVIPAVLPWANVGVVAIARPLLLTLFLPLAAGLLVRAVAPRLAARLIPLLARIAQLSLILLIAATFALNLPSIIGMLGSGALAAAFLLTLGAFVIGYTLGGKDPARRAVLGLGTAQRNVAAAMVVASRAFEDPGPLVMVVVSSMVAFTVLFPAAYLLKRGGDRRTREALTLEEGPLGGAGGGARA